MVWTWASLFLITLVVEIFTVELVSVWFAVGSFVAFFLALCTNASITVQILVFLAVSVLLMVFARKIFMKMLKNSKGKTNLDMVIGSVYTLNKKIEEENPGEISINGVVWRVYSSNGKSIKEKAKVKIIKVEGNKFIVEEVKKNDK